MASNNNDVFLIQIGKGWIMQILYVSYVLLVFVLFFDIWHVR